MRLVISLFILFHLTTNCFSQLEFKFANNFGGNGVSVGTCIVSDSSENIFHCGYFTGTIDFDPGPNIFNLTSNGLEDAFICKLDSAGNFIWAKNIGGTHDDRVRSINIDNQGYLYITGDFFSPAIDLDPNSGILNFINNGGFDIFLLKLDSNSNLKWAKNIGGTGFETSYSIKTDKHRNIYYTGYFDNVVDFDPGSNVYTLASQGSADIFISKLDSSGNFVWAKSIGALDIDIGTSLAIDDSDYIYTTGYFKLTSDFDPGIGVFNLTSQGDADIFISKLDSSGNFVWAISAGGTGYDVSRCINVDQTGNVIATGSFRNIVDFDPSSSELIYTAASNDDVFILKLNSIGELMWAKTHSGFAGEAGNSLTTDLLGNVYTTGWFTAAIDVGSGSTDLSSFGLQDIFISKLDANGNLICAGKIGGTDSDLGYAITSSNSGNIYLTGSFFGNTDFDPNPSSSHYINSILGTSSFVCALSESCLETGIETIGFNSELSIYPIPSSEQLNIEYKPGNKKISEIEIFNSLNQSLIKTSYSNTLNISKLSPGTYILKLTNTDHTIFYKKFVKS